MKDFVINRTTTVLFLIAVSFIFIQCNERVEDRERTYNPERSDNSSSSLDNQHGEMITNLEDLRDEIDDKINDLESRIGSTNDNEAEVNLEAQREELRNHRTDIDRAIEELENASEENWQMVRSESENLYVRITTKLEEWSEREQRRSDNY